MTLENLLEECEKLDFETFNMFAEILNNRARDKRRRQMALNCKRAVKDCKNGKGFEGIENLMKAVGYAEN